MPGTFSKRVIGRGYCVGLMLINGGRARCFVHVMAMHASSRLGVVL